MPDTVTRFVVTEDAARADVWLAGVLGVSRREAQRLLLEGAVRREQGPLVRKGDSLAPDDTLLVTRKEGAESAIVAEPDAPLLILFADAHLVVVDKPARVPTHPLRPGERGTAANAAVARYPELAQIGPAREAGVVHRLDAGTSGLLCFARTQAAYESMRSAFSSGQVRKEYLALCLGAPPDDGSCGFAIAHTGRSSAKVSVVTEEGGVDARRVLSARTDYRVERRYPGCALVRAVTHTGRMHQIRAHMAALGFPLAGDALYREEEAHAVDPTSLDHPFLHAALLELAHPATGERLTLRAPLPDELEDVLKKLPGSSKA